jgi:hypothetical protein
MLVWIIWIVLLLLILIGDFSEEVSVVLGVLAWLCVIWIATH